jgi:tRNA(fMet)-specific endonuclease VapC
LIDTDVFSEVLKAKHPAIVANATAYLQTFDRLTISAVTVMEIVKGFQKLRKRDTLQRFLSGLDAVEVIPFRCAEARLAGEIYGDLERTGQPIGRADPMIAATAAIHHLNLATGNTEHFERIRMAGYPLVLEDWRTDAVGSREHVQ